MTSFGFQRSFERLHVRRDVTDVPGSVTIGRDHEELGSVVVPLEVVAPVGIGARLDP